MTAKIAEFLAIVLVEMLTYKKGILLKTIFEQYFTFKKVYENYKAPEIVKERFRNIIRGDDS